MSRTTPLIAAGLLVVLTGCGTNLAASPVIHSTPASHASKKPAVHSTPASRTPSKTTIVPPQHLSESTLVLSPESGQPGTVVSVTGYVAAVQTMTAAQRKNIPPVVNIQFGGLASGLNIEATAITWSQTHPGEYTAKFRVPTVPWLTPQGEHPLFAGQYPVTVTCAGPTISGCAKGPAQARGTFALTGPIHMGRKAAFLHFSPDQGAPGTVIHVTGWAPLSTIIGQPFGYNLTWNPRGHSNAGSINGQLAQSLNGTVSGSFQVPANVAPLGQLKAGKNFLALNYNFLRDGFTQTTLAPTPFSILPAKTWASLGSFHPRSVSTNQQAASFNLPSPITNSGSLIGLATATGTLWLGTAQRSWSAISTQALTALAQSSGYPVTFPGVQSPAITSLTMVPSYPHSLFVAAQADKAQYGSIPPAYNTPYYSTNRGSTWHPVPVPLGYTAGEFGGYSTEGHTVVAYFSSKSWTAEETSNGGQSWSSADNVPAPAHGPALVFGPMQDGNSGAMGNGSMQRLLRRNREGRWVSSATFDNLEGTTTLALLPKNQALLLEPGGQYPLQVTQNSGKTWTYVALPPIPGAEVGATPLGMLANGDILEQATLTNGSPSRWYLLRPGSSTWTAVPSSIMPSNIYRFTVSGTSIWWVAHPGSHTVHPTILSVNQNRL